VLYENCTLAEPKTIGDSVLMMSQNWLRFLLLPLPEVLLDADVDGRFVAAIPLAQKWEKAVFAAEECAGMIREGLEAQIRVEQLLLQVVIGQGSGVQQTAAGKRATGSREKTRTKRRENSAYQKTQRA